MVVIVDLNQLSFTRFYPWFKFFSCTYLCLTWKSLISSWYVNCYLVFQTIGIRFHIFFPQTDITRTRWRSQLNCDHGLFWLPYSAALTTRCLGKTSVDNYYTNWIADRNLLSASCWSGICILFVPHPWNSWWNIGARKSEFTVRLC